MKLIEWGPNDTTRYEVTAAELRELVLETSVAYGMTLCGSLEAYKIALTGSTQRAEWARAKKLGSMIRKLTCRDS